MLTAVAAVLADQSVDLDRSLVQLPARSRALPLGRAARARSCGARAFRSRSRRSPRGGQDPGAAGRRRLRREHRRRDRRLARRPACCSSSWLGSQHAQQVLIIVVGGFGAADARVGRRGQPSEAIAVPVRRHAAARGRDGRRRCCWRARPADARHARRLRPLRGDAARRRRHHLHRRGLERVGRGVAAARTACCNYHNAGKVQASSEPQDMRLQRMLGHLTTLIPDAAAIGAGHRLRRRRDGRRGRRSIRPSSTRRSPRSSRWCRRSSRTTSASTTSTSSTTRRCTSRSTTRGTSC